MKRFLPAALIAALVVAVATPVNAGYLIIRVIVEGSGGADAASTPGGGMLPGVGSPMGSPMGPGGLPGGPPRPGGGGMPPGTGMPNPGGGATPAGTVQGDPTRSLVVVIPVEEDLTIQGPFYARFGWNPNSNPNWKPRLNLAHRGEKIRTNLFADSSTIQWYEALLQTPAYRRTRAMDVHDRYAKWDKTKGDAKTLYDIVVSALELGLVDDAVKYSDKLLESVKGKKDPLPAEVEGFVRAYGAMQKAINSPASKRGRGDEWRERLEAGDLAPSSHYSLLYWDATPEEVQRRTSMLEENFKGFYLWHATRGIELPVPDAPLVAVLGKQGRDVIRLARVLDGPPRLPADGFYAPDQDVLVLSPERIDSLGMTFNSQIQQMYKEGVSRKLLLEGNGPKIDTNGQNGLKRPDDVARMQTLALVERLVDDAAATCGVSREGSLQLLYSSGQLPRHVALPEWLSNGSVNFFTRPKDPAFVNTADKKWVMCVATTTGYGGPNYALQRQFRDLLDKQELDTDRAALLKNVLTDAYFLGLRDPRDVNDPDPAKEDKSGVALHAPGQPMGTGMGGTGMGGMVGGTQPPGSPMGGTTPGYPPGPGVGPMGMGMTGGEPVVDAAALLRKKRDRLAVKAQATSWALYYYLAKDRPNDLRKFVSELAALPRDLPLDGATVLAAFCRSFSLDGSKESLAQFAKGWLGYLSTVAPAGIDIPLVDPKPATSTTGETGMPPGSQPGTGSPPNGRN